MPLSLISVGHELTASLQRMKDPQCLSTHLHPWVLKHKAVSVVWITVHLYFLCYSWIKELDLSSITGLMAFTVQGPEDKPYKLANMMKSTAHIRALCTEYNLR